MAERYIQLVLAALRAILQHGKEWIFEWDLYLRTAVQAINTRLVHVHGFSPSDLLFGFEPNFSPFLKDFEDELRAHALMSGIPRWQAEGATMAESAHEPRLAALDEIRSDAIRAKLTDKQRLADRTYKAKSDVKKGDLVLVRSLAQNQQRSHKLEPQWKGPDLVTKVEWHVKPMWVRPFRGRLQKKYHINEVKLYVPRTEADGRTQDRKSFAYINREVRASVQQWADKRRKILLKDKKMDEQNVDNVPDEIAHQWWEEKPEVESPRQLRGRGWLVGPPTIG
ncbi:MAG: hypothetical protein Q9182_004520 [Xanthomendoza sp. 2 TL-2023]